MKIRMVEYSEEWAAALEAFNARLAAAGRAVRFPPPDPPDHPPRFHNGLRQSRYLAVEERGEAGHPLAGYSLAGCPLAGAGGGACVRAPMP